MQPYSEGEDWVGGGGGREGTERELMCVCMHACVYVCLPICEGPDLWPSMSF